jgi:hypothetical protein
MPTSRLTAKAESKREQLNNLRQDVETIGKLLENVTYTKEQEYALASVGVIYVTRAKELEQELFVILQLLEVMRTNEAMESSTRMH